MPESVAAHLQCLCGGLAAQARFPSLWMAHCHCSMCQRAHGAAFVTWAGFPAEAVRILDPQGLLRWYPSSPGAERGSCSRCGSPLFFRSERWPDELHLARANFTTPLDREPQAHVFYETHADWITLGDDLPRRNSDGSLA